jgi:hypothetical protein
MTIVAASDGDQILPALGLRLLSIDGIDESHSKHTRARGDCRVMNQSPHDVLLPFFFARSPLRKTLRAKGHHRCFARRT